MIHLDIHGHLYVVHEIYFFQSTKILEKRVFHVVFLIVVEIQPVHISGESTCSSEKKIWIYPNTSTGCWPLSVSSLRVRWQIIHGIYTTMIAWLRFDGMDIFWLWGSPLKRPVMAFWRDTVVSYLPALVSLVCSDQKCMGCQRAGICISEWLCRSTPRLVQRTNIMYM